MICYKPTWLSWGPHIVVLTYAVVLFSFDSAVLRIWNADLSPKVAEFQVPTPFIMWPSEIWQASDSQRMSDGISKYTPERMPDRMSEYMSDRWGSLEESTVFFYSPRPTCETGCSKPHAMGGWARKNIKPFAGYPRSAMNSAVKISLCFSLAIWRLPYFWRSHYKRCWNLKLGNLWRQVNISYPQDSGVEAKRYYSVLQYYKLMMI